jgi:hypothetical protein
MRYRPAKVVHVEKCSIGPIVNDCWGYCFAVCGFITGFPYLNAFIEKVACRHGKCVKGIEYD